METLEQIASKVIACTLCGLSKGRKNAVPGEGPPDSKLFIIGEAPGRFEDEIGRPFIGISGKFLTKTLVEAGIKREKVFITNVVKCRPPDNRKPVDSEISACHPYLAAQLGVIKPKLILALGASACNGIGLKFKQLSELRGKLHEFSAGDSKIKVLVTFHPSFARRSKKGRETFLSDIKEAARLLEQT